MGSEGASMEHIMASELYPKKPMVSDVEGLTVPYPPLCGESVLYLGRTSEGTIALSNFRIFIRYSSSIANVPLGLIDTIESRDIFFLYIYCKDGRMFRCVFEANDTCLEWYRRLSSVLNPSESLQDQFAFSFHAWCIDTCALSTAQELDACCSLFQTSDTATYSFGREVERMGFDLKNAWRICYVNENFKVCGSYPQLHIVPASVPDKDIEAAAQFRSSRRFPSVVWRDTRSGAVIVRCSQPEVGWLGWRSPQDESLLQSISAACKLNPGTVTQNQNSEASETGGKDDGQRMLIVDARSYAAAVANRAKGGGCECQEYYGNAEIQFMNLANIHTIRKSFQALRVLCSSTPDQANWLSGLEGTKWSQHVSSLLKASILMVNAIDKEGRPVLVHCSDGWDRTPQLVALTQIMLDPYYRTAEGFAILVEREWIEFGHKFADRCGHGKCLEDPNERCPVFLQFLDCVFQLLEQFPCAFQFNSAFLVKLVQHTYSCLFGNFLCNTVSERQREKTAQQTSSVWTLLRHDNTSFKNYSYIPTNQALRPSYHSRHLKFWSAVYLSDQTPTVGLQSAEPEQVDQGETSSETSDAESAGLPHVLPPKTRSCDDLVAAVLSESPGGNNRRLSDPNISSDPQSLLISVGNGSVASDMQKSEGDNNHSAVTVDLETQTATYGGAKAEENKETSESLEKPKVEETTDSKETCKREESEEVKDSTKTAEIVKDTSQEEVSKEKEDAQIETNVGHTLLESKPFEGSTDTLTGDLAQIQSAKCAECESDNQEKLERTQLSVTEENEIRTLMNSATVSTSTTDISDSCIRLQEALLLQPSCGSQHLLGISAHLHKSSTAKADNNILSLHIPEANGAGRTLDLLVCNPPSLKQTAAQVVGVSRGNSNTSSTESEMHTPMSALSRTPNSTSPPTPSANRSAPCWPNGKNGGSISSKLDIDGLITWMNPGQKRLIQMEAEYLNRIAQLQRQLLTTQCALKHYMMNQNGGNGSTFNPLESKEDHFESASQESGERSSVEGSDLSWEAIEERDANMTLWVPDHAVTHCAGCHMEFWIVRRRHHCRNCGKVYCNDCTNYTLPVPTQQLNTPVRVCRHCYGDMLENRDELTLLSADIKESVVPAVDIEAAMMDDASDSSKSPVNTTSTTTITGSD